MSVILRIIIIVGIVCFAGRLQAAQDRDLIIGRALDRIEQSLNGGSNYTNITFAEPELEVNYGNSKPETVRLEEITIRKRPDFPLNTSKSYQEDSSLTNFKFGFENFYHKYKEQDIMEQSGFLYGLYGAYTFRTSFNKDVDVFYEHFEDRDKLNMFRLEGLAAFGSVDFKSDTIGNHKGRENFMYEIRGLAGYDFLAFNGFLFTPYSGIAYRYLRDRSPGRILSVTSEIFSFERESAYIYMPFGLTAAKMFNNGWVMEMTVEYDFLIDGSQINHYNDGGATVLSTGGRTFVLDSTDYDQDKGYGFRGSTKFTNENERISFFIEPYFRLWKLSDSETKQFTSNSRTVLWFDSTGTVRLVANQPKNSTTEIGLKLGLRY